MNTGLFAVGIACGLSSGIGSGMVLGFISGWRHAKKRMTQTLTDLRQRQEIRLSDSEGNRLSPEHLVNHLLEPPRSSSLQPEPKEP